MSIVSEFTKSNHVNNDWFRLISKKSKTAEILHVYTVKHNAMLCMLEYKTNKRI